MSYKKEIAAGTGLSIGAAFLFLIVFAIIGGGMLIMTPFQQIVMRETHQQSHQYVEAKQGMLIRLVSECEALGVQIAEAKDLEKPAMVSALQSQRSSIVEQIRHEVEMLPASELPRSVVQFLAKNPV